MSQQSNITDVTQPIVGITACVTNQDKHQVHSVGSKYIHAICQHAGVIPVLIPAIGEKFKRLFNILDGVLLTGSYSNVQPQLYKDSPSNQEMPTDPERDQTTLPMIQQAFTQGVPVLGICRGLQEINVALGGSLYQAVHEQPGFNDHREDKQQSLEQQYAPSHAVSLSEDGYLATALAERQSRVNSLHGQGIRRLAKGLQVEALAEDGLVEAVSGTGKGFLLGVQWHPEWRPEQHPLYQVIFQRFGQACRDYQQQRCAR